MGRKKKQFLHGKNNKADNRQKILPSLRINGINMSDFEI